MLELGDGHARTLRLAGIWCLLAGLAAILFVLVLDVETGRWGPLAVLVMLVGTPALFSLANMVDRSGTADDA